MASKARGDFYAYDSETPTYEEEIQEIVDRFSEAILLMQSSELNDKVRGSYLIGELLDVARSKGLDNTVELELWNIINSYSADVANETLTEQEALDLIITDIDELLTMTDITY